MTQLKPDHLSDELLNEYLDDAVQPELRSAIDSHIGACASCRQRLGELQAVFVALKELPDFELERDLAPEITATVQPMGAPWWAGQMLVLFQVIVTLSLLVSLWSFFARSIKSVPVTSWMLPFNVTVASLESWITAQWAAWTVSGSVSMNRTLELFGSLSFPELPAITLWLTIIVMSSLWLIGNGLLLRGSDHQGNARG